MLRKSYRALKKAQDLIEQASADVTCWAYKTPFYSRTLDRKTPENFVCCPPDPWCGDAKTGEDLLAFVQRQKLVNLLRLTSPQQAGQLDDKFHRFDWMIDLRAVGTDDARVACAQLLQSWLQQNNAWDQEIWRPEIMGQRLLRWVGAYAFYFPALEETVMQNLVTATSRQGRHLKRVLPGLRCPLKSLQASGGLIAAGIALSHDHHWIESGLFTLMRHLETFILHDGGCQTRRPSDLVETLRILCEVKILLEAAAIPMPSLLTHSMDRVVPALRFFRHTDKRLAGFQGGLLMESDWVDQVQRQSGIRSKALGSLPHTGYQRLALGKTSVIVDTGITPYGADSHVSASPLAFELCDGNDRLVVNCGQHSHDPMWQDFLSATAAHSTLVLDHLDAAPRGEQETPALPLLVEATQEQQETAALLDAVHNGYLPQNGFSHRRRLFLTRGGYDLRGEDTLSAGVTPARALPCEIRFHLHPKASVSLIREGTEALIRLPSGAGWRFHHQGGVLSLDDSVYCGETGLPQKTQQLVIHDTVATTFQQVRWAFQREGA